MGNTKMLEIFLIFYLKHKNIYKMKKIIEGIILILSCQKHKDTRLKEIKLKNEYNNWVVIYVIGDLFLDYNYKFDNNLLTIKCEDSYIHLLKKLVLSIKYLYEIYDIKQGILRCGDDLIFNEDNMINFLNSKNKLDFIGRSPSNNSLFNPKLFSLKETTDDYFMVNYYLHHVEDLKNPQHNLKNNIEKFIKRPKIPIGPEGTLYYISNYSCNYLIKHMENIEYNIFHFDEDTKSYPYTIEDCAVSFILYLNNISFYNVSDFVSNNFDNFKYNIAVSTNKYK